VSDVLSIHSSQRFRTTGIVTVLDGHPATLSWLGAVQAHRTRPLGVGHFGQTGPAQRNRRQC